MQAPAPAACWRHASTSTSGLCAQRGRPHHLHSPDHACSQAAHALPAPTNAGQLRARAALTLGVRPHALRPTLHCLACAGLSHGEPQILLDLAPQALAGAAGGGRPAPRTEAGLQVRARAALHPGCTAHAALCRTQGTTGTSCVRQSRPVAQAGAQPGCAAPGAPRSPPLPYPHPTRCCIPPPLPIPLRRPQRTRLGRPQLPRLGLPPVCGGADGAAGGGGAGLC